MNLSTIDLNLLLVLHVVLEESSVARAAKRLNVTSPAISNALKRLRAALRDPLFVRRGRGLVPTPHVLALAPTLAASLQGLQRVVHGGQHNLRDLDRTFTLALEDGQQVTRLGAIVRELADAMPRAHLRVVSVDVLIASGGLSGTEVDVVVGPPAHEPGLTHEVLFEESATLVVRRDHPRVAARLSKKRFCEERHVDVHIAMGRGGRGHRMAEDALSRLGLVRDIAVTVPTFTAAACLASRTDLIAGIPSSLAKACREALSLRMVRGPLPGFTMPMAMSWHERTESDAGARAFRDVMRRAYAR